MTRNTILRRSPRHLLSAAALATAIASTVAVVGLAAPAGAAATPTLVNQASTSGWPVGVAIFDTVTLSMGWNPTGTLTFSLYGPSDPTCSGAPLFTSVKPVNGNGYYWSNSYVTAFAGVYRWTAAYSGDANNAAAGPTPCDLPTAAVTVAKRSATLSNTASPLSGAGALTTTATINGANPTGTLTFNLYGPNNLMCAGAPAYTSTVGVTGNGSYTSGAFPSPAAGTYQWVVMYSGDGNNHAAGTMCSNPTSAVVVTGLPLPIPVAPPAVTVSASPATVARGGQLTVTWSGIAAPTTNDWLALYKAGTSDWYPGVWSLTNGAASGSVTLTVPASTAPGQYDVRLFADMTFNKIATSAPVTIS